MRARQEDGCRTAIQIAILNFRESVQGKIKCTLNQNSTVELAKLEEGDVCTPRHAYTEL